MSHYSKSQALEYLMDDAHAFMLDVSSWQSYCTKQCILLTTWHCDRVRRKLQLLLKLGMRRH